MFPKIDSLPGAQSKPPFQQRNRQIDSGQHRSNVRRHVIFSFDGVNKQRITIPDKPAKKILQIPPDVRVRIFLDQQ